MTPKTHNLIILALGLLLGVVGLLSACTEDTADTDAGKDNQLVVMSYLPNFAEPGETRAAAQPYGELYPESEAGAPTIGLFLTPSQTSRWSTLTYRGNDQWASAVSVRKENYYVYGFMPTTAVESASVSAVETDYAKGAVLTLTGVNPVLATDPCVLVGIQQVPNAAAAKNLQRGVFDYEGKEKGQNFAYLLFDHIYASTSFQLKVNADYNNMRTIKLKTLGLKTSSVGSENVTVTVRATDDDATNPITNIQFTGSGESDTFVVFENAEGLELSTEEKSIVGYFAPTVGDGLKLVCTYDVYDKKGTPVRLNCSAENDLSAKIRNIQSGEQVLLHLTITPTYLYVLSDPELDNPTITVN